MQQPMTASDPPPASYTDAHGGLVAFGILQLLLATACLGVAAVALLSARFRPPGLPPGYAPGSVALGSLFYLALAVVLGWLGAGSILARRWARALDLVLGWIWLVFGTLAGIFLLVLMPRMFAAMPEMQSSGAQGFAIGCMATFSLLFMVLLPLAFVLFYRRESVRLTCEARDPLPRWTDRCPAPVLALAVMSGFAAPSLALSSLHAAFPLFGRTLIGAAGAAAFLLFAAAEALLAWGFYRLRPAAWWGRLALWLFTSVSTAVTLHRGIDWQLVMSASGQPDNPVVRRMLDGMFKGPLFAVAAAVLGAALVGYMLWIRRYFVPRPS